MKLAMIAAIGKNRVIGKGGKLPWHISEDLKRFKKLTTGHAVLMGRKTYESIGSATGGLPNRRNVVLSSHPIQGVETYRSLANALHALEKEEKTFVIGGGELFSQLLDHADELYLTFVDQETDGDAFFPPFEHLLETRFKAMHREEHNGFTFVDYVRKPG